MDIRVSLLIGALFVVENTLARDVLDIMFGKSTNEFNRLLRNTPQALALVAHEVTVFAPSDDAMQSFDGDKDASFVLNHMVNVVVRVGEESAHQSVTVLHSMSPGSPSLYVQRSGAKFFVNGAEIIMRNLQASAETSGASQRLHIIDAVLEPLKVSPKLDSSTPLVSLTAGKLLRRHELFEMSNRPLKLGNFTTRVRETNLFSSLFDPPGLHTFFIPIDESFVDLRPELLDADVIHAHVVPNQLLLTRASKGQEKRTAANTKYNCSIDVSLLIQLNDETNTYEVMSNTGKGNRHHRREKVLAKIVLADLPVSNGIVHLISSPLVIVASSLWEYLLSKSSPGSSASKFVGLIERYDVDHAFERMLKEVQASDGGTLLVPSNEAIEAVPNAVIKSLLSDADKAAKIFGLHFLGQRIASNDVRIIRPKEDNEMFGVHPPYPGGLENNDKVWLYQEKSDLLVDGLGVTAKLIDVDIGASNGIVHMLDKMLGVSLATVQQKIAEDPMTQATFSLGEQMHFNKRLDDTDELITFLAPSDNAWHEVKRKFASAHKALFIGDFGYQSRALLETHVKMGEALSVDELVQRSKTEGGVRMMRGLTPFTFTQETDDQGVHTYVEWEGLRVEIIRGNLKCSNGYVHVVDGVLMKRRDVSIAARSNAISTQVNTHHIILAIVFSTFWAIKSN